MVIAFTMIVYLKYIWKIFFVYTDPCSIYRITDLGRIYTSDVEKSAAYGIYLIRGIMIGYICSAITDFVVTF